MFGVNIRKCNIYITTVICLGEFCPCYRDMYSRFLISYFYSNSYSYRDSEALTLLQNVGQSPLLYSPRESLMRCRGKKGHVLAFKPFPYTLLEAVLPTYKIIF